MRFTIQDLHDALEFAHEENGLADYRLEDALSIYIQAHHALQDVTCQACDVDTIETGEYYMVTNELWKRYGCGRGMLCLGCLEERMGRKLIAADFTKAQINDSDKLDISERMKDRLTSCEFDGNRRASHLTAL